MRQKYALCVGINYKGQAALRGCVNDANDWAQILRAHGYEVRTLLDEDATKSALVAELTSLAGKGRRGDRIVFTYSGHGTWVPDADGDEADLRDEALVPADYKKAGVLTDDEMHRIFELRRIGVRATVISDSCHSGTVSRFMTPKSGNGRVDPEAKPKFLPPGVFLSEGQRKAALRVERAPVRGRPRPGVVLLSGCDDNEVSYDAFIGNRHRGAMTANAIRCLSAATTTRGWHKALRKLLPSPEYPQTPQLTASRSQGLLPPL